MAPRSSPMKVGRPRLTSTLPRSVAFARPRSIHDRLCFTRSGPEKRHDTVRQLGRDLDGARSDGRHVQGHSLYRGALGQMSRGTFALEPAAHRGHVAPERDRRVSHVDAERGVDGWMADAETEHE